MRFYFTGETSGSKNVLTAVAVVEPGKFANWIAPPVMGINRQPVDFDYVRFN